MSTLASYHAGDLEKFHSTVEYGYRYLFTMVVHGLPHAGHLGRGDASLGRTALACTRRWSSRRAPLLGDTHHSARRQPRRARRALHMSRSVRFSFVLGLEVPLM